jgi:hypothetical protein
MTRLVPDKVTLKKWIEDEGLSRREIADRIEAQTGQRPVLSTISMAAARYGIEPQRNRHEDVLPWRVKDEHGRTKEAVLLRKLGRRKAGLKNSPRDEIWLDGWLAELKEKNAVVTYVYDSPEGFYYIPRLPEDGDGEYDVIRRPV